MLVLARKESQRILIGKDIVLTVVRIRGNQVRLGIEAPPEVSIDREEVATWAWAEQAAREAEAARAARQPERVLTCEWTADEPIPSGSAAERLLVPAGV